MRHNQHKIPRGKWRRGMSFIDVIFSLIIIGLLSATVIVTASLLTRTMRDTADYTIMKVYATSKLEAIQTDLEIGEEGGREPIDAVNYNDDGKTITESGVASGIAANVSITDVGTVFGEPLYLVEMDLFMLDSFCTMHTSAVLRRGCTTYAP